MLLIKSSVILTKKRNKCKLDIIKTIQIIHKNSLLVRECSRRNFVYPLQYITSQSLRVQMETQNNFL
jgi:hypothetical protein